MSSEPQARLADALALAAQAADELVLHTVRDTHRAMTDRAHAVLSRPTRGLADLPVLAHAAAASSVYAGIGLGLRTASAGLAAAGAAGLGPAWETGPRSRTTTAAVNGIIGDRLAEERPGLAIGMAVRRHGRDVPLDRAGLASAYPEATGTVVVLLPGLCEDESAWERRREQVGRTYPETVTEVGGTPVLVRANTGLSVRENGVALASLLDRLVRQWPVPVGRLVLVGHSMGGLVARAACAVAVGCETEEAGAAASAGVGGGAAVGWWTGLVTDVITLGTPHLGAPLARQVGQGSRALYRLPETAALGRLLDRRSVGVGDLVAGLGEEVPALPRARYRLVSATLTRNPRHPVGRALGDLLVRAPSARGEARGRRLFPDAELLTLPGTGHLALLNHPDVHRALRRWLS